MPLSIQDFTVRLREISQSVETLNNLGKSLSPLSQEQWQAALQQAMETIPEFSEGWNALQAHIDALVTVLEHYHTLATEFLEEGETLKLPRLP
jgi:hypothetical protein